jgi:hypothetical protein
MGAIRAYLVAYLRASFARGRASLRLQPAVRIALDAGEAAAVGAVDELFARLSKLLNPAAGAAFVTETVDSIVARVNKEIEMANTPNQPNPGQPQAQQGTHQTLAAAGCPDPIAAALAHAGVSQQQAQQLAAAGIDWTKIIQNLPQLIAMLLAMFGKTP